MSKVSTAQKIGVVARVAAQQAGRSRIMRGVTRAVSTTGRAFGRALHQLWLEVTGVVFLIMGLSFAGAAVREYGKYQAGQAELKWVVVAIFFTLMFAWFGVSSFWRVHKKGRSGAR